MKRESRGVEKFETITQVTVDAASTELGKLIWMGNYKEALSLADKVFAYRSGQEDKVDREAALIGYASNYYSAATRLWRKQGVKAAPLVGKYMNTALRSLQKRIENEIKKQGAKKGGVISVSLDGLTANQLDVTQAVYRTAGEMADHIPLVKPLRELLLSKRHDPVRDFDAAALLAIRAGIKKVEAEKESGTSVLPHTEIFLRGGAFDIAQKYGWEEQAVTRAQKLFELGDAYPWPSEEASAKDVAGRLAEYGQAARVARHLRDVARTLEDKARAEDFGRKAEVYAAHVPDQRAKL